MRKGITLIELVIAIFVGVLILAASVAFFSMVIKPIYRSIKLSEARTSLFQAIEIINSDLIKAGYGLDNSTQPVLWDETEKKLTIKYVYYDKDNCTEKHFGEDSDCDYIVVYKLDSNNLKRRVNSSELVGMFSSSNIKVLDFKVKINKVSKEVSYTIKATVLDKNLNLGDNVVCRNWK